MDRFTGEKFNRQMILVDGARGIYIGERIIEIAVDRGAKIPLLKTHFDKIDEETMETFLEQEHLDRFVREVWNSCPRIVRIALSEFRNFTNKMKNDEEIIKSAKEAYTDEVKQRIKDDLEINWQEYFQYYVDDAEEYIRENCCEEGWTTTFLEGGGDFAIVGKFECQECFSTFPDEIPVCEKCNSHICKDCSEKHKAECDEKEF